MTGKGAYSSVVLRGEYSFLPEHAKSMWSFPQMFTFNLFTVAYDPVARNLLYEWRNIPRTSTPI